MINDPYKILGISRDATDEEIKRAYRRLAKQYHPDRNPGDPVAAQKMQEINEAYDTIVRMRQNGGGQYNGGNANSRYTDIRNMIRANRVLDAEMLLDGVPSASRDAEWHFLKGSVLYKKGWLEDATNHYATACRMDPTNAEYRAAFHQMQMNRQTGGYRTANTAGGCSGCDVCSSLLCADCCCECMGGDLIRCC